MKIEVHGLIVTAQAENIIEVQTLLALGNVEKSIVFKKERSSYTRTCKVIVNGKECGVKAKGLLGLKLHESLTHGLTKEKRMSAIIKTFQCSRCVQAFATFRVLRIHESKMHGLKAIPTHKQSEVSDLRQEVETLDKKFQL